MSRNSNYSQELLDRICDELSQGTALEDICRQLRSEGIALASRTVRDWEAQREGVAEAIADAREAGEYAIADGIRKTARGYEGYSTGEVPRDKLVIDSEFKLQAKFNPKRWGEKVSQEISGPGGGPIETITSIKLIPLE